MARGQHLDPGSLRLRSREDVRRKGSAPPKNPGVDLWWFDSALGAADGTLACGKWRLLYIGATNNLERRISQHFERTARQSTLRLSVGSLLQGTLRLQILPLPGNRQSFGDTEEILSEWFGEHARVAWIESSERHSLKSSLLRIYSPPLNVQSPR